MVAPTFRWEDRSGAKRWQISVASPGGDPVVTAYSDRSEWRPPGNSWDTMKKGSLKEDALVTIRGLVGGKNDEVLSQGQVSIRTSEDPVGAPIFYREGGYVWVDTGV